MSRLSPSPMDIATWMMEEEVAYGSWPDPSTFHTPANLWWRRSEDDIMLMFRNAWPGGDVNTVLDQFNLQGLNTSWGVQRAAGQSASARLWPTAIISVYPKDDKTFVWRTKGARGVLVKTLEEVASRIAMFVQSKLPESQCPHFHIEVVSPEHYVDNFPYNASVHPEDYNALVTAQAQTLDVVRSWIPDAWCWVGVHTMQQTQLLISQGKFVPTILIRCREHWPIDFDGLLVALKEATSIEAISDEGTPAPRTPLQVRNISGQVETLAFRFLIGPDILAASNALTSSPREDYPSHSAVIRDMDNPQVGSSIGSIDGSWSGTFGGFVKLVKKDSDEQKVAILTAGCTINSAANVDGISVGYEPPIVITCPSVQYRILALKEVQKSVVCSQERIHQQQDVIDNTRGEQELEDMSPTDKFKIEKAEEVRTLFGAQLQEYQQQIGLLQRPISTFIVGEVLATSPNIIQDCYHSAELPTRMDWGLVEVTITRSNSINLANRAPAIPKHSYQHVPPFQGVWQGEADTKCHDCLWLAGRQIDSIGDFRPGIWTCVSGRTTPFTAGSINSIPSKAKWSLDSVYNGKESWEWSIGGEVGLERPYHFGDISDSGSWVLDVDSRLIGLYTGGAKTIGYITPINEVITDVEKRLPGWTVELP